MDEKKIKAVYISDLKKGDRVNDYFMLSSFKKKLKRDGNPYITVGLSDKSGRIEGKIWDNIVQAESVLKTGSLYRIRAVVNEYQGHPELNISGIEFVSKENKDLNIRDFTELPKFDTEKKFMEMKDFLKDKIKSEYILKLIDIFSKVYGEQFRYHFGAQRIHHAYPGGLLIHTFSVIKILEKMSYLYNVDSDILLTGALFHDIGKIEEFTIIPSVGITVDGGLLGHIVLGVRMFDELIESINGFPQDLSSKIKHLIISHHGEKEFGSPEIPKTKEALMLHIADLLDSKIDIFEKNIDSATGEDSYTDYIPVLGRRLLRE